MMFILKTASPFHPKIVNYSVGIYKFLVEILVGVNQRVCEKELQILCLKMLKIFLRFLEKRMNTSYGGSPEIFFSNSTTF